MYYGNNGVPAVEDYAARCRMYYGEHQNADPIR